MRVIEGVSKSVNEKMDAVSGHILREDGLILRECPCGVRHPVGDIHEGYVKNSEQEAHAGRCCQLKCCETWNGAAVVSGN